MLFGSCPPLSIIHGFFKTNFLQGIDLVTKTVLSISYSSGLDQNGTAKYVLAITNDNCGIPWGIQCSGKYLGKHLGKRLGGMHWALGGNVLGDSLRNTLGLV